MYCNRLHAWWSTQSRLATLHSSLIARQWFGLQTLWRFRLKDLSIDEMVGAWCFGCLSPHGGLPVGFLLLWYSVLFTVESLLAHLSRRLMGELIVYQSLWRPSVRPQFQTSSPLKPLGQLTSNYIWRLLRTRERKFVQMVLVTWPRWPPRPYMVKTL